MRKYWNCWQAREEEVQGWRRKDSRPHLDGVGVLMGTEVEQYKREG